MQERSAMALPDSNVLKLAPDATQAAYRSAPHNIEAEQGLLGAILVNNDAFYRVSDFLEPKHFFEIVHQKVYETASSLIRMGKVATPVTLKTFFPADVDILGMTLSQYLARLAAVGARSGAALGHDLHQRHYRQHRSQPQRLASHPANRAAAFAARTAARLGGGRRRRGRRRASGAPRVRLRRHRWILR